jgi:hypothetical protein
MDERLRRIGKKIKEEYRAERLPGAYRDGIF